MKSRAMAIRTKFQVGDKVRIKDCSIARDGGYVGVQGSIAFMVFYLTSGRSRQS